MPGVTLKQRERRLRKKVQEWRRRERDAKTHKEAQAARVRRRRFEAKLADVRRQLKAKRRVYSREQWGARPPRRQSPTLRANVDTLHHSAAVHPKGMSDAQFAARLREFQRYHMDSHGWSDIGYNWAINPSSGSIFECRRGVGAHTLGRNSGNNGILVDGDYTRQPVPDLSLVGPSIEQCRRGARLLGHNEHPGQSTACPGRLVSYAKEHRTP